jgi:hypothetical protein
MYNFYRNVWQSSSDNWVRNPWHQTAYKKEILPSVKNEIDIQRLKLKKLVSISAKSIKNISTSALSDFKYPPYWLNLYE